MGSLSSKGLVTSGEKYQRTCQRPNTESGYQHTVEGRAPPWGGRHTQREAWTGSTGRLQHAWISACTKAKEKLGATLHQARTQVPSPALSTLI